MSVDPCNQYSNNCSQCLQNGCGFCLTSPQFSNYSVCSNKSNTYITKTCTTPQLLNGNWITSGTTCPGKVLSLNLPICLISNYSSSLFFQIEYVAPIPLSWSTSQATFATSGYISKSSNTTNVGGIVGGIIVAIVLIGGSIILVILVLRLRKSKSKKEPDTIQIKDYQNKNILLDTLANKELENKNFPKYKAKIDEMFKNQQGNQFSFFF